jgi:hypothetical protein
VEKVYWLARKRESLRAAKSADSAEARLIHYDLAGRYSLNALSDQTQRTDLAAALPPALRPRGDPKVEGERDDG